MDCPADPLLRSFLRDETPESTSTDLVLHLVQCLSCRDRVISWGEKPRLEQILRALADGSDAGGVKGASDGNSGPDDETNIYPNKPLRQIGQYELIRSIGRGGGGEVFEAMHVRLRRRMAVKVLSKKDVGDETIRRRFLREMESIGQLNHPHIVHAYDAGEADGTLYLAMELVDGENVESLARRVGPLPVAEACEIVRQAALGLQHVHENKLVHRDLKPSNLLTSAAGVKIADLGLALLDRDDSPDDQLTGHHTVLGTADYIAPEQTEKSHHVDIRADIYGLGCTLFRLLSGRPPYATPDNDSPMKKMWAHQTHPIPNIQWFRSDVPSRLCELLQKLMAKAPQDRIAEPWMVAEALLPFSQASDVPSLIIPGLVGAPTGSRSSTERDRSDPQRTPSQSSQPTVVQDPTTASHRQSVVLVALTACVVCLLVLSVVQYFRPPVESSGDSKSAQTTAVTAPIQPHVQSKPDEPKGVINPDEANAAAVDQQAAPIDLGPIATRWKSELGMSPLDLPWGRPMDIGSARIDEGIGALVVQASKSIRLVQLGVAEPNDLGMTLQFKVHNQTLRGGYGVFLGYRKDKSDVPSFIEFQSIAVLFMSATETEQTVIIRRTLDRYQIATGHSEYWRSRHVKLKLPNPSEALPFTVRTFRNKLLEVNFAGSNCADLCSDEQNSNYSPVDFEGPFGLFVNDASAWFSNPHLERIRQ